MANSYFDLEPKVDELADIEGCVDKYEMLELYGAESVVPGICTRPTCSYSTGVEPDQAEGYCEGCGHKSVMSFLVMMGII